MYNSIDYYEKKISELKDKYDSLLEEIIMDKLRIFYAEGNLSFEELNWLYHKINQKPKSV